jgi:hypothetical protein
MVTARRKKIRRELVLNGITFYGADWTVVLMGLRPHTPTTLTFAAEPVPAVLA